MNWKKEAENDLRNYRYLKEGLENTAERLKIVEARMIGLKAAATDSTPVMGGGNRYEDNMINCIVEKQRLEHLLKVNKERAELIKRGLNALNEREAIAVQRFYLDDVCYSTAIDRLRDELGYEEAQLNRIRGKALYHFTLAMFGIAEL